MEYKHKTLMHILHSFFWSRVLKSSWIITSQLINAKFPGKLENRSIAYIWIFFQLTGSFLTSFVSFDYLKLHKASQSDQILLLFAYLAIICEQYVLDAL